MNIRKIIKEEINDFDWVKDTKIKKYEQCSHFTDNDANQLCKKINTLKSWLHKELGLRSIIDNMLSSLKIVQDLTDKYQKPLKILYDTGKYPEIKLVNNTYTYYRLLNAGLVLDKSGNYHYVNKLNTNYSDLAELVTDLLVKGGKSEYGKLPFMEIKKYLESIKPALERLIIKYYEPNDLKQFIRNTVNLTVIGDESEDYVSHVLQKYGMTQLYQGGDGDFIDMLFGTDLIMDYKGRVITCQVKSNEYQAVNASKSTQYKKIDYFISPQSHEGLNKGIVIYNRNNQSFIINNDGKIIK